MYDIAIIGAGPAGSTLARLIGNRFKVLLIDKRQMANAVEESPFEAKCCGGLLAPDAQKMLARFYINIDRGKFDRWLVSLVPSAVDMRFGSLFKSYERTKKGFNIKCFHNGKELVEQAQIIIGADGANSAVRRKAFSDHPMPRKYIAVQEWFHTERTLLMYNATLRNMIMRSGVLSMNVESVQNLP